MIEINSTLLPTEEKIADFNAPFEFGKHGSSILSMTRMAEKKGYRLICNISCNAIYVEGRYYPLFLSQDYSPADFYTYEGIHGQRFWRDLALPQKWRKLVEAVRREWVSQRRTTGLGQLIWHFSKYAVATAARFLRS